MTLKLLANVTVLIQALTLVILACIFSLQGQWRLGLAQGLYAITTLVLFTR